MWKSKRNISIIAFVFAVIVCISIYVGSADNDIKNVETVQSNSSVTLYSDVNANDWFYDYVKYVSEKGLMNGTADSIFSPYDRTTRGMIVTILWRLDGELKETGNPFSDVSKDAYYYDAIAWASNHKIVDGYDDNTTFGADDAATREQMVSIIYRYAAYKGYDISQTATLDKYADADSISSYASDAFKWGYANGIITGTSDTTLSPKEFVQRCQVAAILQRFCDKFAFTETAADCTPQPMNTSVPSITAKPAQNSAGYGSSSGGSSGSSSVGGSALETEKATNAPESPTVHPSESENSSSNYIHKLIVNDAQAKPGDIVQVKVTVENNPGILGVTFSAYYEETYCTLESVEAGEAFDGILELTESPTLGSGAKFLWDGIDITEDQVKDGAVLLMNFRVADNAPEGRLPITIKCSDNAAVDRELNTIPLHIENGSIIVTK